MSDACQEFQILVVDDEEIVVSLVRDALEDDGVKIQGALSGEEALRFATECPCDLLVTDIRMPGMTGIELSEKVRAMYPDIAIIFMTGYANLNSAKDAIKQGAFDYIMKPFELTEIRQAVRKAIEAKKEAAEKSPHSTLSQLSDLSQMLFTADDRGSLVTSSLRFAMMHQKADHGTVLYFDPVADEYRLVDVTGTTAKEERVPKEPIVKAMSSLGEEEFRQPVLIDDLRDLALCRNMGDDCDAFLRPEWMQGEISLVAIPVRRSGDNFAIMFLGFDDDTIKVKDTDLTFLSITAGQLAMSLENLSLLEETRKAYKTLKELQDETIELEKMAARGQLSAEIGHELNNFLGVVAGNLSLLEFNVQKNRYDDLPKYVSTMTETIEKMKRFTGNLMDLRSISSSRSVIYFDQLFTEVMDYLMPQKRFRDVEIQIKRFDRDIPFLADGTQIQQLLYNLFNNAADATRNRDVRQVTASVEKDDGSGRFRFVVTDTGEGFSPELRDKAFHEKFTTKSDGHGFGLVVCGRIIQQHGGTVTVDSEPGRGSIITVEFPLAATEAAVPAP